RNHQMLVTNVTLRKAYQAQGTNWQREERIVFDNSRDPAPVALLNLINRMTSAKERSDYVKKRISSWEGYLKIQEQGMDIPDIKTAYSSLAFSHDFSRITLSGCGMKDTEWKSLRNLSVRLTGIDGDVGTVMKAKNRTVEVELNQYIIKQLREKGHALDRKEVVFSNFASLSQIRRLRQGFTNLEKGLAVNPQLDRLLFEEKPSVAPLRALEKLSYHNRLNHFQQQAVRGAMAAEDLYVIQGPPGTGKTTVISEICLQNAKKGLRTLVASQSNLAVDNALGRLLAHKDIRILRVGRTESIEEEGKKFIEENVGQYWKTNTLDEITAQFEAREKREAELGKELESTERVYANLQPVFEQLAEAVEEKKLARVKHKELQALIEEKQTKIRKLKIQKEQATQAHQTILQKLETLEASILKDQGIVDNDKGIDWFQNEEKQMIETIQQLERASKLKGMEQELAEKKREITAITEKRRGLEALIEDSKAVLEVIENMRKVDELIELMKEQGIEESTSISYSMSKLDMIRDEMAERKKLEEYNQSVTSAIGYVEGLLAPAGIALKEVKERALAKSEAFTSSDIDQFLEKLRSLLKGSQSVDPKVLGKALTGLYKRQNDIWRRGASLKTAEVYIASSKRTFLELKRAITGELLKQQQQVLTMDEKSQGELEHNQRELEALQQQSGQLAVSIEIPLDIDGAIQEKKDEASELEKLKESFKQAGQRLEQQRAEQAEDIEARDI
ncbi:MAG TPA: AAA domain-containing protein, partial [Planococcus sp. (in: firmicutes)]|nr:AAA domain-containing protein [Planococcus sp. (in: firmicutes)]